MAKIELDYIEIDGLLYPNIETGMEHIEDDLERIRLRTQAQMIADEIVTAELIYT